MWRAVFAPRFQLINGCAAPLRGFAQSLRFAAELTPVPVRAEQEEKHGD